MNIGISDICTAFDLQTIGSKVNHRAQFMSLLEKALQAYDTSKDRAPGQHFIQLPEAVLPLVSCGMGKRTQDPSDYVARLYRGNVSLFLERRKAAEVTGCAVVLYTRQAYLKDPDIEPREAARVICAGYTHVIVAVLAFGGPDGAQLSPYRFVHNLAGGNNEALLWTADEIRAKAAEILEYEKLWCTVAD